MGFEFGEISDDNNTNTQNGYSSFDKIMSPDYQESLNYATLFNYKDPSQDLNSLNLQIPSPPTELIPHNFTPSSSGSGSGSGLDSTDDSDSDGVLKYISQMLMEENMEEKPCMFHALALQAAEKPFYDALGKNYPPSPNQHPFSTDHHLDGPNDNSLGSTSNLTANVYEPIMVCDSSPNDDSSDSAVPQWSFGPSLGLPVGMNMLSERDSMIQFQKGVEEASKFLPKNNNLVIDLDSMMMVKKEREEIFSNSSRGSKIHYLEDEDFKEGRSSKQSAISTEETELSDLFDKVLHSLHMKPYCKMIEPSEKNLSESNGKKGKTRVKKQGDSINTVDLRSMLIQCAQSTASDDRRTASELLKQIREHSSDEGDGCERLAHYFAYALEARLAGTGSQIYTALSSKKPTAADMIKAYEFYFRACPFKKIFIGTASQMILKASQNVSKLHIVDFGILYGFTWPNLIQHLSKRPGGPPKLIITGVDLPQPGFKPAERVEATGRRLAKYCERFNVPFEFHAIAQKWETIKLRDIKTSSDELLAVCCLSRFKNLLDETIMVDSPRNQVMNLIRRLQPNIFVHGIVNGSYNAPFFVTRFREALFHYSTLFDMFDENSCRDEPERLMFEKEFYGREIMNVVACEGTERVERPETCRQWQARKIKVGFKQLPLDQDLIEKLKTKVKMNYHRDFVIDIDGKWVVQGWKGRVIYAISAWKPA